MNRKLTRAVVSTGTVLVLVTTAAVGAFATVMDPGSPRQGSLTQVGPIADNGFPAWYRDSNGLRLEACVTMDDPLCAVTADTVPDPDAPISFPDNFPDEMFYQLASGELTTTSGVDVIVVMDLEGAFSTAVQQGDQMVFGRIRIRAKGAPDGVTWRITHPYGVDQFTTSGGDGINMTEDIGVTPGAFGGALQSRIGPFLKWNPAIAPAAPDGYTGDPGINHQVVGSPYGTNFIKIEQIDPDGNVTDIGDTDLFSIQGRLATNSGVDVDRAAYSTGTDGKGFIDVFASSEVGQSIQVSANPALDFPTTPLRGQDGHYYARIAVNGNVAPGTKIEVVNAGDKPVTKKLVALADQITVTQAAYNADTRALTVAATSSDALVDGDVPALSVTGFGALTGASTTFSNVNAPPANVTVTSTRGGSVSRALTITGAGFVAGLPVAAFTAPAQAQVNQPVMLDGSGSSGDITTYDWSVNGPSSGTIAGQGTAHATWTPTQPGSYDVTLRVTGPGGTSLPMTRTVAVAAASGVHADAGADQTVQRGRPVTLNGSATTGQQTLTWSQVSGPTVNLSDTHVMNPTFTYPLMKLPVGPPANINNGYVVDNAPLVLKLTAMAADGSTSVDQVTISPLTETFTGLSARYRTRGEWRVSGTSSIKAAQNVAMVLGSNPNGPYIGQGAADATGAFAFRGGTFPVPGPGQTTVTFISATGGTVVGTLQITN